MGQTGVSVVVPLRNHQAYVSNCLMGVFRQSPMPEEVIVVDRGSTDASLAIVADRFKSVRILRCPNRTGLSRALNRGIRESSGDLVAVVFPEVKMERGYFKGLVGALESPPHADAGFATGKIFRVFGGRGILDSAGMEFLGAGLIPVKRGEGAADCGMFDAVQEVSGAPRGAVIYRRKALETLAQGGEYFDELFSGCFEDVDLCLRARNRSIRGVYVPSSVAYTDVRGAGRTLDAEASNEYMRAALILKNANSDRLAGELCAGAICRLREVLSGARPALPALFSYARLIADYPKIWGRRRKAK